MELSRHASRLAPDSAALSSSERMQHHSAESSPERMAPSLQVPLISSVDLPQEPEDARLTGGTRSLSRRLLALNIPGSSVSLLPLAGTIKVVDLKKRKKRKVLFVSSDLLPQDA